MRDDLVETDFIIHVYTVCWNEEVLLPHFLRHYAFADRIVVYDNESTDRSRILIQACEHAELRSYDSNGTIDDKRYLDIKNTAWKESRGKADLVIVCDMDEFLYHPRLGKVFQHMMASGYTLLKPLGYEMIGDRVPAPDEDLLTCIPNGMRSYVYDKCIVFDPNSIEEIHYGLGCHTCRPEGRIDYLRLPDVCLLHYKHLSFEYVVKRYEIYSQRLSGFNKQRGIGVHYKRKGGEIKQMFERLNVQKSRVITETNESRMKWTVPQVPAGLEVRLRRGLTELNKRRFGTALADLDVVASWRGNGWRATAGIAVIMAHADRPYDSYYCLLQAAALTGEPVRGWLILAKFYRRLGFGRMASECQHKYRFTVARQQESI